MDLYVAQVTFECVWFGIVVPVPRSVHRNVRQFPRRTCLNRAYSRDTVILRTLVEI